MPVFLKTKDEIELMRPAGRLAAAVLAEVEPCIRPGATTQQFYRLAEEYIHSYGAEPVSDDVVGPSGSILSTSVNGVSVHNMPRGVAVLHEGDIVTVGCRLLLDRFHGYRCRTFIVGEASHEALCLLHAAEAALREAVGQTVEGRRSGDIGHAVRIFCRATGCRVVCRHVGHAIGRAPIEKPLLPVGAASGTGVMLREGMCFVIAPVVAMSARERSISLSAQFGHTVAVRCGQAEILSTLEDTF